MLLLYALNRVNNMKFDEIDDKVAAWWKPLADESKWKIIAAVSILINILQAYF